MRWWRSRSDEDFSEEIRAHIDFETDRLVQEGMSQENARTESRRRFGNVRAAKERFYEGRRWLWLDRLFRDLRYALRTFSGSPGFTAVVILTLAVGIGANSIMFGITDAMLLQALPYRDPAQLVALRSINPLGDSPDEGRTAKANIVDWQSLAQSFEAIAGYRWATFDMTGGENSERLEGLLVTPEFFEVFPAPDVLGRTFVPEDNVSPKGSIIVGHDIWERRFGSNAQMVGDTLEVNLTDLNYVGTTPLTVLGVVTEAISFPPLTTDFRVGPPGIVEKIDFWAPTPLLRPSREERFFDVVGRLRPGVTVEQAQAEMDTVALNLAETYPATNDGLGVRVVPLQEHVLGNRRNILLLLVVSSGMVLLIAIGNAAGFLLTQGLVRHKEILTRTALGASRLRIVKQFLTESLVVALPAAILAVLLTLSGTALLRPFLPDDIPLIERVSVDPKVLGFTLITTLFVMCLVSIIPALRVSRPDRLTITGLSGRGMSANRRYHRTVFALIAVEVSLTFMLLIASGLMLKSAARLLQVDPGFDSENLLTMSISLPANKFEWTHNVVFSRQVIDSIESLNEVQDAAVMQGVPMHPGSFWGRYEIAGEDSEALVRLRVVSPGYFDVMQVPILSGRDFDARDEEGEIGRAPQVLISQVFAERYWPGEDAVGKRIGRQTIIGVVGDVRYAGMDTEPTLDVYYPEGLYPQAVMTLLVRTRGDPMNLVAEIRNRIRAC